MTLTLIQIRSKQRLKIKTLQMLTATLKIKRHKKSGEDNQSR